MPDVTRRGFLTQVSVTTGVGIAGGLGLHKLLLEDASPFSPSPVSPSPAPAAVDPVSTTAAQMPAPSMESVTLAGPMLIHIRDLATAEIAMMVGTQELLYRDPELVSRLVQTAAAAGRAEG
jgi:hypothetical protein